MRAFVLILLLALFASSVSAYELAVKATISQGTLAVGTNVSVMTGGVELYSQKAGTDGYARFNVTEGSYFVILRRYPYPTQVLLQSVESDVDRTFTINPVMSYSGLFGQIIGPGSFEGTAVSVYSGSTLVKKASTDKNGFYSMALFIPEGNYDIIMDSPGFAQKKERRSLVVSEYMQFDARLEQDSPIAKPQYSLAAPSSAEQSSVIAATVMLGGQPVAGQTVYVSTPSGEVQVKTDESGIARINAAGPGTYSFKFSNLTATTVVPSKVAPKPKEEPPEQPLSSEPQPPPVQDYSVLLIAFAAIVTAMGALLGAALLFKALAGKHGKPKHGRGYHHKKE